MCRGLAGRGTKFSVCKKEKQGSQGVADRQKGKNTKVPKAILKKTKREERKEILWTFRILLGGPGEKSREKKETGETWANYGQKEDKGGAQGEHGKKGSTLRM